MSQEKDYESECGHEECTRALIEEVRKVGFEKAERLCLELERQELEFEFRCEQREHWRRNLGDEYGENRG